MTKILLLYDFHRLSVLYFLAFVVIFLSSLQHDDASLAFVSGFMLHPAVAATAVARRPHRLDDEHDDSATTSTSTCADKDQPQQQQQQQRGGPFFRRSSFSHATTRLQATKSATEREEETVRNIFHEYNKPLVLMGVSSAKGNEMERLAEGLSGNVISLPSINESVDEWIASLMMETTAHSWPDVILLDFASIAENEESYYADLAHRLYQDAGLLSIYINVQPTTTEEDDTETSSSIKKNHRLEDDVFVQNTDYELCIRDEGLIPPSRSEDESNDWNHIEWELARILARARLVPAIPGDKTISSNTAHLTMGKHTFFLSLTFDEIEKSEEYIPSMCLDVDAMEYRADLLKCRDNRFDLIYGMQLLRRYCRPHTVRVPLLPSTTASSADVLLDDVMPIVYTVRTQNQAGTFPDDDSETGIPKMFELLQWGLRAGVEVLDVESAWDKDLTDRLLQAATTRYSSQILGSHHVVGQEIPLEEAVLLFENCAMQGRAHGAKVVLSIESEERDRMAYEAALIATELAAQTHTEDDGEKTPVIPNISLILGDIGKFSRIINLPFTPVTHESLPSKAAPGQLTAMEIMTTRLLTKIFEPKKYCILGHNIAYSVSPQMHGAAFMATKLPHTYVRADVETVDEFVASDFWKADDFGGASVTIPHKQSIIPYVDILSEAAQTIGSVNTLVVKEEFIDDDYKRVIYGDNTDWKGIFNPLQRLLGGNVNKNDSTKDGATADYALILGAGGTARAAAFVAEKLGLRRVYYNRTPAKAQDLAKTFPGAVVGSLDKENPSINEDLPCLGELLLGSDDGGGAGRVRVVISTLPAAANFELPEWLMQKDDALPIVFDVNYKPFNTKLLLQAEAAGCRVVRGSEMLWEQGVGQFELWTERTAPYSVMKEVVLDNCLETKESAAAAAAAASSSAEE